MKILHVRLPCWKIWPAGVVILADHLRKSGHADQRILDLALIRSSRLRPELQRIIQAYSPDVIAFSWRNIQTFGPHDASPALETVLKYDFAPSLKEKIESIYSASGMIFDHVRQIRRNLQLVADAVKAAPSAQVVIGGPAFSTFPEMLIERLPQGVIGVIGEGERALQRIVDGEDLSHDNVIFREGGRVQRFFSDGCFDLSSASAIDYDYIAGIFPEFDEYTKGFIGIQTKRGCPYNCVFCVYNVLEGKELRFKSPDAVATEIQQLNQHYGVNKIWFTDSQFCSTKETVSHAEELLDQIIGRQLPIGWTGYIRVENLSAGFARKALQSGILSFELSFTGSQKMVNELRLGYDLSKQIEQFQMIKDLGYSGQQVKLYLPLNAPGETKETLLETIESCKKLYAIFGENNVVPWIFFLAIQPGTALERRMIKSGYLKPGYNPLSFNPFSIKKLLYNPPPLGPLVAAAHLKAKSQSLGDSVGRLTLRELERMIKTPVFSGSAV
ncbi:MAG: radical SAM protein [Actinomycetota bacterium]|nr:radical SAM protein [Actinomycetota bacterium]